MNTRATHGHSRIMPIIAAATSICLVFLAATCAATPQEAIANAGKHALPTIRKHVSTGGAFADTVTAMPGQGLTYRIVLTLPEDVESPEALLYTVVDEPDLAVAPNLALARARLITSNGAPKANLNPSCRLDGQTVRIDLGNLRDTGAELVFGDRVVVEYPAVVSSSIKPGAHRNVAQLLYGTGAGWEKSAKVMACVNTFASDAQPKNTASNAVYRAGFPKTGDGKLGLAAPAAITAIGALALSALAMRRRKC